MAVSLFSFTSTLKCLQKFWARKRANCHYIHQLTTNDKNLFLKCEKGHSPLLQQTVEFSIDLQQISLTKPGKILNSHLDYK